MNPTTCDLSDACDRLRIPACRTGGIVPAWPLCPPVFGRIATVTLAPRPGAPLRGLIEAISNAEGPPRGRGEVPVREPPLANQRHLFEIPKGVAFFNCANVAPQLRSVRRAGELALARNARPWEIKISDWFTDVECLRSLVARLIGADEGGVALVPSSGRSASPC